LTGDEERAGKKTAGKESSDERNLETLEKVDTDGLSIKVMNIHWIFQHGTIITHEERFKSWKYM